MNLTPATLNRWDPRLVMDLAIGVDSSEEIAERYNLTDDALQQLFEVQSFRKELSAVIKDVRDNGVTFKAKAKIQAETYLETLDELVANSETPAGVRLDAIKSVVKWAGLEPKEAKDLEAVPQVNIQINF